MNAVLGSPAVRVVLGVLMLATPFVLLNLSTQFGAQRGVWVALAGVGLGMVFERPFKPYNITYQRWLGREHWTEVAFILGLLFGMVLCVADLLVSGGALVPFVERIWLPIHRVVLFAGGLTLLRQGITQLGRARRKRGRVELDEMPTPMVKPALPRAANASDGGGEGTKPL